ncbi:MAG TPA: DUF3551 domain-containing protein [Xanthomonadaceae bacterium]|nr:DUF3551 domain-containing protein [Xanthomonadaceae bacterium]
MKALQRSIMAHYFTARYFEACAERYHLPSGPHTANVEVNMRAILFGIAAVVALLAADMQSTQAQVSSGRNPWCLRDGPLGRGTWDCSYQTLQQCRISSNNDSDGFCTRNPNYQGPPPRR